MNRIHVITEEITKFYPSPTEVSNFVLCIESWPQVLVLYWYWYCSGIVDLTPSIVLVLVKKGQYCSSVVWMYICILPPKGFWLKINASKLWMQIKCHNINYSTPRKTVRQPNITAASWWRKDDIQGLCSTKTDMIVCEIIDVESFYVTAWNHLS